MPNGMPPVSQLEFARQRAALADQVKQRTEAQMQKDEEAKKQRQAARRRTAGPSAPDISMLSPEEATALRKANIEEKFGEEAHTETKKGVFGKEREKVYAPTHRKAREAAAKQAGTYELGEIDTRADVMQRARQRRADAKAAGELASVQFRPQTSQIKME